MEFEPPIVGSEQAIARHYADAVQRFQSGRLGEAEALCRGILLAEPLHVDNLLLLGAISTRTGRPAQALDLIGHALDRRPDYAMAHFNLGVALQALGRAAQAAEAYGRAAALAPDFFPAQFNLANALRRLDRDAEAETAYRAAIALEAGYAPAHFNLGNTLLALGRHEAAVDAYRQAIALQPDYEGAVTNLAGALQDLGRTEEAADLRQRAVELNPANARAHYDLGNALNRLKRHGEALEAYRRAVDLQPDFAAAHNNLGSKLSDLNRHDEAIEAYHRAIEFRPGYAEAYVNLGIAHQVLGRLPLAVAAVDRALQINPGFSPAWFVRSSLKTFVADDPDLERMEALLADADTLGLEDRLNLGFALGKAWMDVGQTDRAFAHLDQANRLKRAALTYDVSVEVDWFSAIAQAFPPEVTSRFAGAGDGSDLPIFVLGMPRSGTTLVEQILASHPLIHGAGELAAMEEVIGRTAGQSDITQAYPKAIATTSAAELAAIGRAYLQEVSLLAAGKPRLVDKMPGNFRFAGLIALALPNARIIHCRRDPVDTCLSCYSRKFTSGLDFCYDLRELGRFYRAYDALMAHWRRVLPPDRFLEVQYEEVVADLETQGRRLIAFCGLDWDVACLAFHATERPVRTASASQVRQPIYRAAIARWKPYERHLAPLIEVLK